MMNLPVDKENNGKVFFPGKIAVVTAHVSINEDDYYSAGNLIEKYGKEKIIHTMWPLDYMTDKGQVMRVVAELAADNDVKALIIVQAVSGTNAAIKKLKEIRDDVFIVYCEAHEANNEAAESANLILAVDDDGMGAAMVKQARKQGAKVFVHYSFPRHMSIPRLKNRRDLIQQECVKGDVQFINTMVPDPAGEAGFGEAEKFILNDVKEIVTRYGDETAFFCTNCSLQAPLIKAVVENHAVFPQPCCPSPYHGFPKALGIETNNGTLGLNLLIGEACRIVAEKNMTDRLSTWPVSAPMMFSNAGAEYAIKWINGEVPKTGIDSHVLAEAMNEYVEDVIGEASNVYISSYSDETRTYDNYKLVLMSYLDF